MKHTGEKTGRILLILFLGAAGISTLWGAEPATKEDIQALSKALDIIWILLSAVLVFFMQAGFAMVETGLTRAKNSGNILMKNLMDFSAGVIVFALIGWGLMFGKDQFGLWGNSQFFLAGVKDFDLVLWVFQAVFAATAATIVSGAVAERTRFKSYLVYSIILSGIIYPVSGHWVWGEGGWLARLGFHDFAGSAVVHALGGWVALAGALVLGVREGKYGYEEIAGAQGKIIKKVHSQAIPGHNLPLAALGTFILWFGWFGFNGGSTLSGSDATLGTVILNTQLGGAAGAVIAMTVTWVFFKKPDISMTLNGALAGLVGITAGANVLSPLGAVIVGAVAGGLVVASVEWFDKILHVDDPVGAVSVHGVCGFWGVAAVGLFSTEKGLFYGFGTELLKIQILGSLVFLVWGLSTGLLMFFLIKKTIGLRVSKEEELKGLDLAEHNSDSYHGFQIFKNI